MTHDTKIALRACIWLVCCIGLSVGSILIADIFIDKVENDIPYGQRREWYKIIVAVGIPILVVGAQGINNILVHGWTVFFTWLSAEDMGIIINELQRRKVLLEKEKKQ